MVGAIIGDIVGSRFEFNNIKTKEFDLMNHNCFFTDDTVMSLAIAKAILESNDDYNNSIVGVIGSDDHFFICYWNKSIYNYMVENGFKRADNITEAYINDDATFLIKIYMK